MQIIVSPVAADAENFLLEVAATMPVATLRATAADRVALPAARIKLVCEGVELEDGATLAEFYVTNLSTVRLVVLPAAGGGASGAPAGSPAPAAAAAAVGAGAAAVARPAADDGGAGGLTAVLSAAEVSRAVVVTGLAAADPAATEKVLESRFGAHGELARLLFQDDRAAAGGQQRAVIVFERDASAASALALDGALILGPTPVRVMLASSLPRAMAPAAGGAAGDGTAAGLGRTLLVPSTAVAHFLAQGYLYGHQGVAHVRAFSDERGVSARVRVVMERLTSRADALNARYHIVPTVKATYEAAAAQAADLDRELGISTRVSSMSQFALARAAEWASIAMRNPVVASTVTAAREFVSQAAAAVEGTYNQAKLEVAAANAAGTPALPPAGGGGIGIGPLPPAAAGGGGVATAGGGVPAAGGGVPAAVASAGGAPAALPVASAAGGEAPPAPHESSLL